MSAGSILRRPSVFLALGLCAVAAVTTMLGRLSTGTQTESKRTVLPDVTGAASYPAFSNDGNRLAYAQRGLGGGDTFHIVVRRLPTGAPQQLTSGPANDTSPAWAPDGASLAFVRTPEEGGPAQLVVISSAGGSERVVAQFPEPHGAVDQALPALAWSRDGKSFATVVGAADEKQPPVIAIVDASSGSIRRITSPAATDADWNPEFSPDGATILFVRLSSYGANLYTCASDGAGLRQLTFENHWIRGVSLMPDGRELIYSADRNRDFTLWRMALGSGSPRATLLSAHAQFPAVAPKGDRIVFTESPTVSTIWRATLGADGSPSGDKAVLRSQDSVSHGVYSPDGRKIAFISDDGGAPQIWVSDSEGSNPVPITKLADGDPSRPEWSPDGKWLIYEFSNDQGSAIYKVAPTAGAEPVRIVEGHAGLAFARDGKSFFYEFHSAIYQVNLDGSGAHPVTPERRGRAAMPAVSADGKYLYYQNFRSIWRIPVKGGEPEEVFQPGAPFMLPHIEAGRNGIYFEEFDPGDRSLSLSMYSFQEKRISRVVRLDLSVRGRGDFRRNNDFSVSPDGRSVLHPRIDQSQTNLVLIDNFK